MMTYLNVRKILKKRGKKMTLTVIKKTVYGNDMIYPACEASKQFCLLIGTKTLTPRHIETIKDLGYTFALEQQLI